MSCVYEQCVTDSPYLNCYLLEFTTRKLHGEVLKFLKEGGLLANISIQQYFKEMNARIYHCEIIFKLSFHFPAEVGITYKIWESSYR